MRRSTSTAHGARRAGTYKIVFAIRMPESPFFRMMQLFGAEREDPLRFTVFLSKRIP